MTILSYFKKWFLVIAGFYMLVFLIVRPEPVFAAIAGLCCLIYYLTGYLEKAEKKEKDAINCVEKSELK